MLFHADMVELDSERKERTPRNGDAPPERVPIKLSIVEKAALKKDLKLAKTIIRQLRQSVIGQVPEQRQPRQLEMKKGLICMF